MGFVKDLLRKLKKKKEKPPPPIGTVAYGVSPAKLHPRFHELPSIVRQVFVEIGEGKDFEVNRKRSCVNPYCVLKLGSKTEITTIARKAFKPVWRERFKFSYTEKEERLHIEVWDHGENGEPDVLLGTASFYLDGYVQAHSGWCHLHKQIKKKKLRKSPYPWEPGPQIFVVLVVTYELPLAGASTSLASVRVDTPSKNAVINASSTTGLYKDRSVHFHEDPSSRVGDRRFEITKTPHHHHHRRSRHQSRHRSHTRYNNNISNFTTPATPATPAFSSRYASSKSPYRPAPTPPSRARPSARATSTRHTNTQGERTPRQHQPHHPQQRDTRRQERQIKREQSRRTRHSSR
eukprot:TRINITY_DN8393_c0_g1_i2.p1 TRINITY_DN8393_c0_g1~~TRINITY_DN8393_c0_g1_i2.p1  ORF type:complete len:348 (+),score=43.52 TRINITY_DN8393_c0_g1_i2:124-1167(+)